MKKRIIITGIIVAIVHLVLAIGSVMVAFGSGMEAFDNPDYQPTVIERLAEWTAGVLMQPGMSLWTPWMSKNMPNVVEWMLCVGNSFLWGFAIAMLINVRALATKKESDNKAFGATS